MLWGNSDVAPFLFITTLEAKQAAKKNVGVNVGVKLSARD